MLIACGRHLTIVLATAVLVGISTLVWPIGDELPERKLAEVGAGFCFANDETLLIGIALEGPAIRDEHVRDAARVVSLQRLSLAGSQVTRHGISSLQSLPRLSALNLGATPDTSDALDVVARLSTLKELRLDGCEWLRDGHLAQLAPLTNLETISLSRTSITPQCLERLKQFPRLAYLQLDHCSQIDDSWIDALQRLAKRRDLTLSLSGTEISAEGLARLRAALADGRVHLRPETMVGLRGVGKRGQFVTNEFGEIHGFRCHADAEGIVVPLQPGDLATLGGIPNLVELNLEQSNVDDEMLAELPLMPRLETLKISLTSVTDKGLAVLGRLPNLTTLWLMNNDIDGHGLVHLRHATRLTQVRLQLRDSTELLSHLESMSELQLLTIDGPLTDGDLLRLSRLPKLISVELIGSGVRAAGIANLASAAALEELRICGAPIGDADIDFLATLRSLKWLVLVQTSVTRDGWERLIRRLPNTVVNWNAAG